MFKIKTLLLASTLFLSISVSAPVLQAQTAAVAQAQPETHQRRVAIEGSNNFRDIGGYITTDGRTVRWGIVYRSGAMNHLTPEGFRQLEDLGIVVNFDFRATQERQSEPVNWPQGMVMESHAVDYDIDMRPFMALFSRGDVTAEQTRQVMATFYKGVPFQFAPQYSAMLHAIIDGEKALVFNCSAGKDRTGVATAILLRLLGVPDSVIMEDYLLSNVHYVPHQPQPGEAVNPTTAFFMKLAPDVQQALMGVDATYLEAAFAAIDAREGGWERYVREDLNMSAEDVTRLKTRLLM